MGPTRDPPGLKLAPTWKGAQGVVKTLLIIVGYHEDSKYTLLHERKSR